MTNDEEKSGPVIGEQRKVFDLDERMAKFGDEVIRFCRGLKVDAVMDPLVRRIIKSSTSVGANCCEADNAVSRKEFRQKLGTCKKESRESKHWLRMIAAADPAQAGRA
jgi:four helix bundle protein